ncbi:YbaN family protein [Aestuariispira insulae]|uniref:Inner membrane protein n=1 Tax=Aestuariispira insulae TaxID=1461337 RepID=A0A3D9HSS4_9PROT|nr:YbaN family protein [Aestuariispira insulae]RED52499.1 hypothetical protein DFP90_102520 [Aestuariispira insulae]
MTRKSLRLVYLLIGFIAVGLAFVGILLPIMPTVPFLIVALWAFSKSSEKFHNWLYSHKSFGPILRDWDQYRVVPIWGKIWSSAAMAGSLVMMIFLFKVPLWAVSCAAVVMAAIAWYILSKPSRKPDGAQSQAAQTPAD